MRESSKALTARLEEVEREGGGIVAGYPAIIAITQAEQPALLLVDATPSEGWFLAGSPDLDFLLGGIPSYTSDNLVDGLPGEKGIYDAWVQVRWSLGYSEGSRAPGEDDWYFTVTQADLAMSLDIPERDPRPAIDRAPGEPIGFSEADLRDLRGMLLDWHRIHSIMNPNNHPGHQKAARFLRIVDRLLPPECLLCGEKLVSGFEIKMGQHQACIETLVAGIQEEEVPEVYTVYVDAGEWRSCSSCGSPEVRGATCLDCGHVEGLDAGGSEDG